MLLWFYTFYKGNRISTLFFQEIALISQREVKAMFSITTSSEKELLNVFFNKLLILPLKSKPETYFNANIAAPI